jgi:tetratricopeptide (TPR) repeat protein
MNRLFKWLVFAVLIYLLYAMLTTEPETAGPGPATPEDEVLQRTNTLRDSRGDDPLAARLKDKTLDPWLRANLARAGALVLKAAGEPPDSDACARCLRYIRAAAVLDSLDSSTGQLLAGVLWGLGDRQAALLAGERAVARQAPADTTPSLAWLGGLYLQAGRTDSALSCFRRQLARDPDNRIYYTDIRYYLDRAILPADTVEAVLRLSYIHTNLAPRLKRAWRDFVTWPRRKLAELYHGMG